MIKGTFSGRTLLAEGGKKEGEEELKTGRWERVRSSEGGKGVLIKK